VRVSSGVIELGVSGDSEGGCTERADVVGVVEVAVQEPEGACHDLGVVLGV
jgi:hypothetical protein